LRFVEPKPKGWGERYGAVFREEAVAEHYGLRPPHPSETFDVLASLASQAPPGGGAVLDAGCGPGDLARPLASRVARVDAVDVSEPMIARGRALPGGDASNLRWIVARIEEAPLDPPYTLVVAGDSIHWFEWETALPLFARILAPAETEADAPLAIVHREWLVDQRDVFAPIYDGHSWNDDFEPLDPIAELERRGLFERRGAHTTAPEPWRPTLDELVGGHFSMSGFPPDRLRDRDGFVSELRAAAADTLEPRPDGRYDLDVTATIVWGRPLAAK
jgi:SAM-dependent methyltransferase